MFSAQTFSSHSVKRAPVRYLRRPGSREDAFILDHELELQSFALVGRIGYPSFGNGCVEPPIFFSITFLRFFGGFIVDKPITFYHVEGGCTAYRTYRPWQTAGQT